MSSDFKNFLYHIFLRNFTQGIFFTFGALLLYEKSNSISITLVFYVVVALISSLIKSLGAGLYFTVVKRVGLAAVMSAGIVISAASYLILYGIDPATPLFLVIFLTSALLWSLGDSIYWVGSTTLKLNMSGESSAPGKYSAYTYITSNLATLVASVVGLYLNQYSNFLFLFVIACAAILLSLRPLFKISMPKVKLVSFRDGFHKISLPGLLSNINPDHFFQTVGVPLVLFVLFQTLNKPIWITGIVAIGSMVTSYLAGKLKDARKSWLGIGAGLLLVLCWGLYLGIKLPVQYIALGIMLSLFQSIVITGREARLSREVTNCGNPVEATTIIEFNRSLGQLIGALILLISFVMYKTLPKEILSLGIIFVLPFIYYSIGLIVPKGNHQPGIL